MQNFVATGSLTTKIEGQIPPLKRKHVKKACKNDVRRMCSRLPHNCLNESLKHLYGYKNHFEQCEETSW